MSVTKRIICLANSRKPHGRCIAGVEMEDGQPLGWIRPVSDRKDGEVSERERQYPDGSDPRVLDVIDVPLLEPRPKTYQQENWLLDAKSYWIRKGTIAWNDLAPLAEPGGTLWINGDHTRAGLNDQISLERAQTLTSSLKLIHVDSMSIRVFAPGAAFDNPKRRVQAQFRFDGAKYELWITDPGVERAHLAQPDGTYPHGESYLTVSVSEPYNNCCYKLVAAVIPRS